MYRDSRQRSTAIHSPRLVFAPKELSLQSRVDVTFFAGTMSVAPDPPVPEILVALTGSLTMIGLAAVAVLVVAALVGQRLRRRRLASGFAVLAIALSALATTQIVPQPLAHQPFPDAQEVTEVTCAMVRGHGYTVTLYGGQATRTRYAPGYPLALAPFALFGDEFPGAIPRAGEFLCSFLRRGCVCGSLGDGGAGGGCDRGTGRRHLAFCP